MREYFSDIIYDLHHDCNVGKKKTTQIYFVAHKVRYMQCDVNYSSHMAWNIAGKIAT